MGKLSQLQRLASVAPAWLQNRLPRFNSGRGLHLQNFLVQFPLLASRFVQPGIKVGQFLFALRPQLDVERLSREASLIGGLGVARDLGERAMAGDGLDLINAAPRVGQSRCRRLAQPMKRAVWQTSLIAAIAPPVAKAVPGERRAVLGHQESEVAARHRGQGRYQLWMHGNK